MCSYVLNQITHSTGAESDLDKVQRLANSQIKSWGMGDSIGLLSFSTDPNQDYQVKPYSKHLQSLIDMVSHIVLIKLSCCTSNLAETGMQSDPALSRTSNHLTQNGYVTATKKPYIKITIKNK